MNSSSSGFLREAIRPLMVTGVLPIIALICELSTEFPLKLNAPLIFVVGEILSLSRAEKPEKSIFPA